MLGRTRTHLALALALGATLAAACGGGSDTSTTSTTTASGGQGGTTTTSTSSSSSSTNTGGGGAAPSCPTHEGTVLAVSKLYFGEGNSGEWKKVGFNLDGKVSTGLSNDLCKPADGGDTLTPYPDGDLGIDNSFGKNILPTILSLYPTWADDVNAGIQQGLFTALFKVECLPPTGDAPALTTKLFGGTTLGSPPKWDGTDKWPIEPGLLSDPNDPTSTTISFDKSSVIGNTFDAGKDVTVIIAVPLATKTQSTSIKLILNHAQMKMTLSDDRKSATGGVIGGVLNTEDLVAEMKKIGALMSFCDNVVFDALLGLVRHSSDILSDGTQDPTKTCDGITMGIGFELKEALLGDVGPAATPGKSCP